jgi:hypothetical protein
LELAHQRHDLPNDAATQTSTLVVNLGELKADRLYNLALWLDRIAVGAVLAVVALRPHNIGLPTYAYIGAAALLLFIYAAALVNLSLAFFKGDKLDPYYGQKTIAGRIMHEILPNLLIPAYLLTQLTLQSSVWSAALIVFLIWRLLLPRLN